MPRLNAGFLRDFGSGFYLTKDLRYARWWALRPLNDRIDQQPAIIVLSLPDNYRSRMNLVELEGQDWEDVQVFL